MAKFDIHNDHGRVSTIGEPSSRNPEKWAPLEVVPNVVEVPDELRTGYDRIMPEFLAIPDALRKLFYQGTPANAVRPKLPGYPRCRIQ